MRPFALFLFLIFALTVPGLAQQVSIELGKSPLPINQYYTVSIKLQDEQLKEYTPFPEIEGFKKSTRYSSEKTVTVGGVTNIIRTYTQNYAPLEEGDFILKPFTMKVNGTTVQSQGMAIKVVPMQAGTAQGPNLPDLIEEQDKQAPTSEEIEFVDKEDNAFLRLYTSKEKVFVGEGVDVALYFYLAEDDQRLLDFHDFANQITGIIKQIKQPNVWEETFDFSEITPENVTVQGKPYLRFRLYEAVLYPLNLQPLKFPQLQLKMIKYKVAKTPNLLTEDRQEGFKTFYSRERQVEVMELPPHPLRNVVPVGNYTLLESISKKQVSVNKSFRYLFEIIGEGNLDAVMPPTPAAPAGLEFYPPDVRQDVTRRAGRVSGAKSFSYNVLPREPGTYELSNAIEWIYFNPVTAAYDTLRPSLQVTVTGARDSDALVLSRDLGAFYNIIENEDNTLVSLHFFEEIKRYTNIILAVLLVVSAFVFLKNRA
ncbi:BatD family protein [Pontibacter cellulosilyticus]|uniref:BatD family protein n=1 Tax=Pontibacter cellulosilyticus TaxID=1720253 RepID=A0A923N6B6_9BACT|nr:BatD family protein [Pontibacter cellulosilyticus]MBC5993018.1 BatD family protein [Pontibacter cellulosilyticus]